MLLPPSAEPNVIGQTPLPRTVYPRGPGYLFGVPFGDLGWFATLLMSLASGFAAFFAATFLGIISVLVYNTALHGAADYAISYRLIGLPAGLVVLVIVGVYLGSLWVMRMLRRG